MKNLSSILPAFAVLIIGISLSFWIQSKRNDAQSNLKKHEIEIIIENKTVSIQEQLVSSFSSVEILQYLFKKNDQITRKEFQNYTYPIFHGDSCFKAISWVPRITNQDRAKFESRLSKEFNNKRYTISKLNSKNETIISEEQIYYFPVTYIEPLSENKRAIGYDIYSNPIRKATIDEAIRKKKIQITPRIKLVQDTAGYSFLAIAPIFYTVESYEKESKINTLKGLISAVYKINKLIDEALVHTKGTAVDVVIFDITNNSREYIYGDNKLIDKNHYTQKRKIAVGGREWELNFVTDQNFYQNNDTKSYLLAGISISLLLFLLLLWPFIKERRARILTERLKDEQTARVKTEQTLSEKEKTITEKEKTISEKEEYNRALFIESMMGLALTKMDGRLVDINLAYANIIGRSIEESKNLTYWEITPEKYFEQEQQQLECLNRTGQYGPYEKEYIHKDGHLVPVYLQGKTIELDGVQYIFSSVEDITARKRTEEKARINEARLRKGQEIGHLGYWQQDIGSDSIWASEEAMKIFGFKPVTGELPISTIAKYIPDSDPVCQAGINLVKYDKKYNIEFIINPANASGLKWISAIAELEKDSEGKPVRILGVLHDITERKLVEKEIKKLNAELEERVMERTAQLQSLNKELETFTYSVSHDLKAPLRGIDGYSKLLLDLYSGNLNEEAQTFINTIRSSTKQMNQLIDELLEYSRMERSTMRNETIRIKELIVAITSLYKADLKAGNFILRMDIPDIELVADSKGLTIALRNLLENAMKFSREKANPIIEIAVEDKKGAWLISVKDNGIGFDMRYHDRIFEIFQRLHRVEDFPGTGVGLAMVQKVMLRMHGKVWAESLLGIGSTFFLELPN